MTNVNPENQETQAAEGAHAAESSEAAPAAAGGAAASSFPFRGLAMVLITVAVLLGLWGVYALTQGDGSQDAASDQNETSSQESPGEGAANGAGATPAEQAQDPSAERPSGEADAEREGENGDNAAEREGADNPAAPAPGAGEAGQPGAAGAAGGNAAPKAEVVNVYNNSTIQGLASDVSDSLRERGYEIDEESGNITEDEMIVPENTVFFDPAVEGAEDRARELADLVGGVAQTNVDNLPNEATEGGALTLVLAGEVIL